jgi:hypothetical protein
MNLDEVLEVAGIDLSELPPGRAGDKWAMARLKDAMVVEHRASNWERFKLLSVGTIIGNGIANRHHLKWAVRTIIGQDDFPTGGLVVPPTGAAAGPPSAS